MSSLPRDESDAAGGDDLDPIEATAATWLGRRDRGLTPEETVAFARWRAADPRHEVAVADLSAMWNAMDDLTELRETAAAASEAPEEAVTPARARWLNPAWVFALAACLALAAGLVFKPRPDADAPAPAHFETAIGAQRVVVLTDGSTFQLNTNSAADVRFTAGERRVELLRGEAFFTVAKDAARPFVVAAQGVEMRALGTAFVVRRHAQETEIIVTEGRVTFGAPANPAAAREVGGGQFAVCDPRAPEAMRFGALDEMALGRALAWQTGRLVFPKDTPLASAVAEFNRYQTRQIVLRRGEAEAVRMGGAFEIAQPEVFVRALETSCGLVVIERDAQRIVLDIKR